MKSQAGFLLLELGVSICGTLLSICLLFLFLSRAQEWQRDIYIYFNMLSNAENCCEKGRAGFCPEVVNFPCHGTSLSCERFALSNPGRWSFSLNSNERMALCSDYKLCRVTCKWQSQQNDQLRSITLISAIDRGK